MTRAEIRIAPARRMELCIRSATNADCLRVKALVLGVLAEYGLKSDPQTDADLEDIEAFYTSAGGVFEVVEDGQGQLVGSVGLRRVDERTCELRKMYLAPQARGQGLGRQLLERIIARARVMGFRQVTLETASVLREAIGLYERYGFRPFKAEERSPRCDQTYVLKLVAQ